MHPCVLQFSLIPFLKALVFAALAQLAVVSVSTLAPGARAAQAVAPVKIALDQVPATLNPRASLDATGQRIGALLFRALSRNDANLEPQPDLAEKWSISPDGKAWTFWLSPGMKDHSGTEITATRLYHCLENYRIGKPASPVAAAIPQWIGTRVIEAQAPARSRLVLSLKEPDPYLVRNLTLIRYFWTISPDQPCQEPSSDARIVGSGPYRPQVWNLTPEKEIRLEPLASTHRPLHFRFIRDEATRALALLRGDVDGFQNGLSLAKTRWIKTTLQDRYAVLERTGVNVQYLAFNLRDPALAKKEVRQAIAHAIDRESYVRHKMFAFGSLAQSFLSPLLPEAHEPELPAFDLSRSEKLLETAGFARGPDGIRLRLAYKTTPVREGLELAMILQRQLRKVGIELRLEVVEPAVFLASVRKGAFQLYTSRWVGVADGSIFYRTLRSGQTNNRAKYEDAEMDRLLDQAQSTGDLTQRKPVLAKIQAKMAQDLPYLPLWYWNNALVLRKDLASEYSAERLSLSGGLEPLGLLPQKR